MQIFPPSSYKTIWRFGYTLAAFALFTTAWVTCIHLFTAPAIEQQLCMTFHERCRQLLPRELYDNDPYQSCYWVTHPLLGDEKPHRLYLATMKGVPVAAIVESSAPKGYGGEIQLLVSSDLQGKVLGVSVLHHHETPGLGDKIEQHRSHWILGFSQRKISPSLHERWRLRREGGNFDQLSGATITSRAVITGVENTTRYLQQQRKNLLALAQ